MYTLVSVMAIYTITFVSPGDGKTVGSLLLHIHRILPVALFPFRWRVMGVPKLVLHIHVFDRLLQQKILAFRLAVAIFHTTG